MGHGSAHMANAMYSELQLALSRVSDNFFIGTIESSPTFEDLLRALKKTNFRDVVLSPLMVVAGDHAAGDLAGDGPESWLSRLKESGFKVETELVGLGEYAEISKLFITRLRGLMDEIDTFRRR